MSESQNPYELFAGSKPIDEVVRFYLTVNRRTAPQNTILQSQYQDIYSNICGFTGLMEKLPPLVVTYSTSRRSEIVTVRKRDYLVYDQYLGQTWNILNQIYFNSGDSLHVQTYACKYLAEGLRDRCNLNGAKGFAVIYADLKSSHPLPLDNVDKRAMYTLAQETFLIAHELAHLALRYNDETLKVFVEGAREIVQDVLHRYTLTSPDDKLTAKRYGFPEEDIVKGRQELARSGLKFGETKTHLFEEVACDSWASMITHSIMTSLHEMDKRDIAEAISLCLRHLRLLAWFRALLEYFCDDETTDIRFEKFTLEQLRISANRLESQSFPFDNDPPPEDIHSRLVKMSSHYGEIIDDPILFNFRKIITWLKEAYHQEGLSHRSQNQWGAPQLMDTIFREVDELTGWA